MKLKSHKIISNIFLSVCLIMISTLATALNSDNWQPISISSSKQAVDIIKNTVTLNGNVVINRGSIHICADQVIIRRSNGKSKNEIIEGFGHPVMFYQMQNNGSPVQGHSQKVRYETVNDLIILIGNAYIAQSGNSISSDRITYTINKQQIDAFSLQGKSVTTTLMSKKMQNHNKDSAKISVIK